MGHFVERKVYRHEDKIRPGRTNLTYYLSGPKPKPRKLIDDIKGVVYEAFARDSRGRMYFKYEL